MPQLPPGDTQGSFMLSEQQSLPRYPWKGTKHSKIVQSEPYHCETDLFLFSIVIGWIQTETFALGRGGVNVELHSINIV